VQLTRFILFAWVASASADSDSPRKIRKHETNSVSVDDAVEYLKQWRPKDDGVPEKQLRENAQLALQAWNTMPFSKQVSKDMFLKYVLPYTHFDEPIDDWRPKMYPVLKPFVQGKQSLLEAADALFPAWGEAFSKQLQFKGDQTPQVMAPISETLKKGYASCTGMSIFLANCMRAVGIPARIVGVNEWNRPEKGNHNWVEIWVGDRWNFVDAVPDGNMAAWNKTWFVEQAAKQKSVPAVNAILSPLWGSESSTVYNMSWRTPPTFVPAIDLTANYAKAPTTALPIWESWHLKLGIGIVALIGVTGGASYAYKATKSAGDHQRTQ